MFYYFCCTNVNKCLDSRREKLIFYVEIITALQNNAARRRHFFGMLSENTERIVSKYGETIKRLRWKFNVDNPMNIPLIHFFNLRAYDALATSEGIKTLYELLDFTTKWGWRRLKNIDGVGRVSYKHIIETLHKEGIIKIDADGEIKLIPEIDAILL